MRAITITVPANDRRVQPSQASKIKLVSISGGATTITVKIDGQPFDFSAGDFIDFEKDFTDFEIDNSANGTQSVCRFIVGRAKFTSATFSGSVTVAGTVSSSDVIPTSLSSPGDQTIATATTTTIVASNATREEIIVQSDKSNTGDFRIGATAGSVSDTRGLVLEPGQSLTLRTTSFVVARNVTGNPSQTIRVLEIVK